MSSIPNAKMKHAHVQEDAPSAAPTDKAQKPDGLADRAKELAGEAVEVMKDNPRTAAAIGAAVLAGAAALVGGPAIAKAFKSDAPAKNPAAKKAPAKKPATKKA